MAGAMATESEVKFAVDEDFEPPDLRPLVGRTERLAEQHLRAAYFDTPDHRLWQLGITLRHRTGEAAADGDEPGTWTLKLPETSAGSMLERTEITSVAGRQAVPAEISAILQGIVRRAVLGEIAELDTVRRRLALHDSGADGPWGEVDDDLVTVVGGHNDGLRFRQVELELTGKDPGASESVVDALRSSGARTVNDPKLALALGLSTHDESRGRRDRRKETVVETVQASIRAGVQRLLEHDYRLRTEPQRPGERHVHQARVATRRLRSDLRTFGPILDPVWLRHTTEELRWIGEVLGRVRDTDVLANRLWATPGQASSSGRGDLELMKRLGAERQRAAGELEAALRTDRYMDLLDRLHAASQSAPVLRGAAAAGGKGRWSPDDRSSAALPALVHDRWRALDRRVRKAGRHPTDRQLHRIRIGAKRLRYAAESAVPVVGKPALRTAAAAEQVQTTLGDLHDAVQAEAWLRREPDKPRVPAVAAFVAGMLCRDQQFEQQRLRRQWESDWKQVRRKKNRSWLHS